MEIFSFLLFLSLLFSNNKTADPSKLTAQNNNLTGSINKDQWRAMVYLEDNPPPRNYYILDPLFFIKEGVATINQEFSSAYRYWTQIVLELPCDKQISADAIQVEWRGKSALSIGLDESDMGATLAGENDTATVNCITYYRPPYSVFRYGSRILTDVPEIVLNPSNWAIYSIAVKDKKMSFSKNGKVLKTLKADQTLGKLQSIFLHFKGSGFIDWVKLYHKGQLVMQEDFNQEGKSSIKWQ